MKYGIALLLGTIGFGFAAQVPMKIKGVFKVAPKQNEMIYLAVNSDAKGFKKTKLDSVKVVGNTFSFNLKKMQPGKYEIGNSKGMYFSVYLDKGETRVVIDTFFARSKTVGSITDSLVKKYELLGTGLAMFQMGYVMMKQKYEKEGKVMSDSMEKAMVDQMLTIIEKKKKAGVDIGKRSDLASAFVLTRGASDEFTLAELNDIFKGMPSYVKQAPCGVDLKKMLDRMNSLDTGVKIPGFTQQDTEGKDVVLYDFIKGKKLVMIDFWASWCGPCRKENPHVVELYKKYKSKGFDILGVSLDSKKEDWLKAIADDGLTWTHVSDLGGWKNKVALQYGVSAVPLTILLDENGKIIAKNLRGKELEEKVAAICNQ